MRFLISAISFLALSACGGGGGGGTSSTPSTPSPTTNTAPTISDPGDLSVREGSTAVATLSASDPENDSLIFSIQSGDDRDQFSISEAGVLTFVAAPDYEVALDANTDNTYHVTIQVSDGSLIDTQAITVNVTDAFEGRVVDGPIAGATVVIDLNGNGQADDGEISAQTDENGFFKVDALPVSAVTQAKIIATGGTDTATGKALPNLTLISDVPADPTLPANITPLTTVLSALETEAEKEQALTALGITASPEDLLTTDGWAAAAGGDESAKAMQRVNQQIALLLQTATTLTNEDGSNADVSLLVAETVAEQISNAAVTNGTVNLTASVFVEALLVECLAVAPPDEAVDANTLASVASSVANVNAVITDPNLDPMSEAALIVVLGGQDRLQDNVAALVAGAVSVEDFEAQVATDELFVDLVISDAPDTDNDGVPDAVDTDDDGDGVADTQDAFPLSALETLDTDSDGIGNNADTDDDGDGVADTQDAFPLNALETLDSDGDGAGDNSDPDDDGDGFADAVDAFPLLASEWLDTDGDGVGNNADNDDDGDGINDSNDALPLSAANLVDTDGDGVLDVNDVQPNDPSISKALRVDFTGVESLGLGEAIDATAEVAAARFERNNKTLGDRLLAAFSQILAPRAHANDELSAQTNAISWDENGNIVAASILSSETLFVAEANVSPDGKYVYLLTSAHIQRAIPSLDAEVCSMYRVRVADMTFTCLLTPAQGDIEPKSLIRTQATDFARRGIAFRADGAALMQGFNRDLPEGVDGGTASTSAWFMSPSGEVTPMPLNPPYFAFGVFWLTDDKFAVAEFAFTEALEAGMSQERFVIYSADTLQQVAVVVDGVTNFGNAMVRKGTDVYWNSYVLRGESLLVESSGGEGYPLLDTSGERMLFLIDYIQSQRDEAIANSARNRIFSIDGSIELPLSEGTADWYEGVKQSGTGTDIKYPPVGFSQTHLAYRKTYEPAEPIQTLAGETFDNFTTYQLANGQGSIEIQAATDIFLVRPDADHSGDMTIDYEVRTSAGALEARILTISGQTIANWRADGRPTSDSDYLIWASPSAQREGFCVYEFASAQQQCVNFTDYQSLAVDMEYFRVTRYDDAAVYPDGRGNAFPGIQNTLLVGDELRVFFKDSVDHTYYQAQAQVADFMQSGLSALTITPAVNGAGDSNIVSDAIDLLPAAFVEITDAVLETGANDSVTVDFGRSLSDYAALPELSLVQDGTTLQLTNEIAWSDDKRRATLSYSRLGVEAGRVVTLQIDGPIFMPNQVRRHRLASPLSFEVTGINAFVLAKNEIEVGDYSSDIDGLRVDTVELTTANGIASVDARNAPLNQANLTSAIEGGAFVAPSLSLPLATLPSGNGSASIAMVVTDGIDGDRDSGERQISSRADITWSGDGIRGTITAPAQTVNASYVTSSGATVDLEVENFSADVLQVASSGVQVPTSLNVRIASLLERFDALIPESLVRAGDYHIAISTDLPLVDADGNAITQLRLLISIGD